MPRVAEGAVVGICLCLLVVYLLALESSWLRFGKIPPLFVLGYLSAFLLFAERFLKLTRGRSNALRSAILTLVWSPIYWSWSALALGDNWLAQVQVHEGCMLSEPAGEALLKILFNHGWWWLSPYLSPAAGALATWFALLTLLAIGSERAQRAGMGWDFFAVLLFTASGLHLAFFRGYVETTQLASPFAAMAVYYLVRYLQQVRRGYAIAAAVAYGCACLLHAVHTFWFPVFLLVPLYAECVAARRAIGPVQFVPALTAVGVFFAGLAALNQLEGCTIFAGGAGGGGDATMFVPLFQCRSDYERYLLFSMPHLTEVANIVAATNLSLLLLIPGLLVFRRQAPRDCPAPGGEVYWLLFLVFLAYCALVFLWNFDLGFPSDYDLMTSLGVIWLGLPLALVMRVHLVPPLYAKVAVVLAMELSWMMMSGLFASG